MTSIEKVSKPVFAEARINFLKTGLNNIYKKEPIPDHPILQELKYTIEKVSLKIEFEWSEINPINTEWIE